MNTAVLVESIHEVSPRLLARIAGALYFFSLLAALLLEVLFPGRFDIPAGLTEISGMFIVTLILYSIFNPVARGLAMLAASANLAGLAVEAIRLNAHGSDIAMVFHGVFCILTGYLIARSTFLPRVLGAMIAIGGLAWLTYPLNAFAHYLSPYNLVCGLAGEASVFLWLLIMGVNAQGWKEQSSTGGKWL
jgi:Domain of unknown function (DUF4386)